MSTNIFPIARVFISEQCLFRLAQAVSLSHEIGRTVFMLNVNVVNKSREL